MPKFTDPERDRIREMILEMHLSAVRPVQMLRVLAEKGYPMKRRQLDYYLFEIKQYFVERSKFNRDEMIGKSIDRLEDLYRKCISRHRFLRIIKDGQETEKKKSVPNPDYHTALEVHKELNKLMGLITHHHEHTGAMTFEGWLREAGETLEEEEEKPAVPTSEEFPDIPEPDDWPDGPESEDVETQDIIKAGQEEQGEPDPAEGQAPDTGEA
jgi:hypothetical protein